MGLIRFQPSRRSSGSPEYKEFAIQSSATFPSGAPMQRDTVPADIEEHAGAGTTTGIIGVSMFGSSSGVPAAKGSTAFGTKMIVAIANRDTEFVGTMINGSTVQTPVAANNGVAYGFVKVSGEWYVDEGDTSDTVLTVTGIDINRLLIFFKFLDASVSS